MLTDDSDAGSTPASRRPVVPGTARAALRHRDFRVLWSGILASNTGTWMQNVLLGAYGYTLTKSPLYVAVLFFAQLGPILFLSPLGGLLADDFDRRRVVILTQIPQLLASIGLAVIALAPRPSTVAIAVLVAIIGIFNALSSPATLASLPGSVPRVDIDGAVALTTVQMNLSRVIGPALGAALFALTNASTVFAVNSVTFLAVIAAFAVVRLAPRPAATGGTFLRRLLGGFALVRSDPVVRRVLGAMVVFSVGCLPFIGLLPAIAAQRFAIDPKSVTYGVLYGAMAVGAVAGSLAVGSVFHRIPRTRLMTGGFAAYGVLMAVLVVNRSPVAAFPLVLMVGFAYFVAVTALSNVLQRHLTEAVRGRVTALWMMSFGGTVPLGVLLFGSLADRFGLVPVIACSAVVAALLALFAGRRIRSAVTASPIR